MITLLFDIDGTLINAHGSGQSAMEQALYDEFDVAPQNYNISTAGRTDRAIITDLLTYHQVPVTEEHWNRLTTRYADLLPKHLKENQGSLLPGVQKLLNSLAESADYLLGLLTGNLERSGWQKVQHFQIDHHFQFGAFGDHNHDRDDVARTAHQILQDDHNIPSPQNIWIIGDTPADIQCARAIGARSLAVATGIYSEAELYPHEPDCLLQDLTETDQILSRFNADA